MCSLPIECVLCHATMAAFLQHRTGYCVCVCVCVCVFVCLRERESVCVCSQHTHTHTHKQVSRIHESLEKVAYMDARVDELDNKINHVIQV